ncbi:hypothetical protein Btru_034625 [Bulinus truncatus]|nr:hypothetical protein Btru_034625 [Bulinus truncatus]
MDDLDKSGTIKQSTPCPLQDKFKCLSRLVNCMSVFLVALTVSIIYCYIELATLKATVTHTKDFVEFHRQDYLIISTPDEEILFGDVDKDIKVKQDVHKRHANYNESSSAANDWVFLSSFGKVPIVALASYCKETKTYCAVHGSPGKPGNKGEKGEKGDKGDIGPRGPQGLKGEPGSVGLPGDRGEDGLDGLPGLAGVTGFEGPRGMQGLKGKEGDVGKTGLPGHKGVPGFQGVDGWYVKKGPMGQQRLPGNPGRDGQVGKAGPPGSKGLNGTYGPRGPVGPRGMQGNPGRNGKDGTAGPQGQKDCSVVKIGTPLYVRNSSSTIGSWMVDLKPNSFTANKVWMTNDLEGTSIQEFVNMTTFKNKSISRVITVEGYPYYGTGHIVYNGTMYYQWSGEPKIVGLDLSLGQVTKVREIPDLIYKTTQGIKRHMYGSESSFVDFNADENGLWMIYSTESSSNIKAALLNETSLDIIKSVDVDVALGSKGKAFIVCGKLYTIRHHNRLMTLIDEERDLWKNTTQTLKQLYFKNPYGNTVMLSYNLNDKHLMSWDGNKQLQTPLYIKEN